MRTCTRRLEFDAAHRVVNHESKCRNLHGHRYIADVTCAAEGLDELSRVIDFSVIKERVGGFVDTQWDHALLVNVADTELHELAVRSGWRVHVFHGNPTAETIAQVLHGTADVLLRGTGVSVVHVRVYETPNCWSDYP